MALLALACGACLDFGPDTSSRTVDVTPPRLLDALCAENAYATDGAATRITGPSSDSCAFELGPGSGSVTFSTDAAPEFELVKEGYGFVNVLVVDLAQRRPVPRWLPLASPAALPPAETQQTELTVSSDGGHLAVLDIEVKVSTTYSGSCSVPRRTRRPPRAPRPDHRRMGPQRDVNPTLLAGVHFPAQFSMK